MQKNKLHIGTSGWSYKDWKEIFYPAGLKTTDWLAYYAQTFSITEINSSFYHLPRKQTVAAWVKKVPDHFLFCPKMSRFLTHLKKLSAPEEPLQRFFDVFEPMYKKMGPVLLQLPASVHFEKDKTEHLYGVLKEQYKPFKFSLEVRHNSWLSEESIVLMKRYNIGFVISQSGKGFPYLEIATAKHIYVRFHGPKELYASLYSKEDMDQYARLFKKWLNQNHSLWIFFNNDFFGYAIENAKQLETSMEIV